MKKLILGAAVSASLLAGVAQARITVDTGGYPVITPADTYEIYLSGASAPNSFIEQLLTNTRVPAANRMCDATQPIYKYSNTGNRRDQNAYLCVMNPRNPALQGLAAGKRNLLLYKRSAGGSAMGVNPIIADSPVNFLRVDRNAATGCGAPYVSGGLTNIDCAYTEGDVNSSRFVQPDFGVSDTDPGIYFGANTPPGFAPVVPADLARLHIRSAATLVFGVPVTTKLRNALQQAQFPATNPCNPTNTRYTPAIAEQERCMPSLTSHQISSIFTGQMTSWRQLRVVGGTTNLFDNTTGENLPTGSNSDRIHICRRTNGSGTGAQFNAKFLNYPCSDAATPPKLATGLLPEGVNETQVHQLASASQVGNCLHELDTGTNATDPAFNNVYGVRWGIGVQSTENNRANDRNYRFIRIDGASPTLVNVINGRYRDWVELSFQWNRTHTFDTSELPIIEEYIKQAGNPIVMGVTNAVANHTWGQSGYMAVPASFDPQANGRISLARPVNPLSHATVTEAPHTCRVPALYNPRTATSGLQLF